MLWTALCAVKRCLNVTTVAACTRGLLCRLTCMFQGLMTSDRAALHCIYFLPQVKAGQAAPSDLQREQEKLGQMDSQLQGLQKNYSRMRDQASALLQRMGASGADAAAEGSTKAASGLTSAMYAGLKFSGLAMRVAADVVSSVTDDAGKMLRVRGAVGAAGVCMRLPFTCCLTGLVVGRV